MQENINEDNKPHLCVPTLDGNAHVIPAEVFDKIVSGEMKITDMEDWEIITRTAFSEWLRGLETAAKRRRNQAGADHERQGTAALFQPALLYACAVGNPRAGGKDAGRMQTCCAGYF